MSALPPTVFGPTEGILLMRQNGRTVAIHLTTVMADLTAVVNEPDIIPNVAAWLFANAPAISHYEVEATGHADRIWVWEGADPFAKPEIAAPRAELRP